MEDKLDWTRVREEEEARSRTRRAWLLKRDKCTCRYPPNAVGLALSGGGIRSATFSLGLMRSLSEQRLIHCIDYLSTVSGGGYAAAFYCSLFVPNERRGPAPPPTVEFDDPASEHGNRTESEQIVKEAPPQEGAKCDVLGMDFGRRAIAQLRQGGHYLAPNGTSDALFAGVIALRNWFAVAITAGMALLALFFTINFAIAALEEALSRSGLFLDYLKHIGLTEDRYRIWRLLLAIFALWPVCCAWAYWFTRSGNVPLSRLARPISMQTVVALLIVVLAMLWPAQRDGWREQLRDAIIVVALLSIATYILAELASFLRDRSVGATRRARNCVEALAEEDRVRNRLSRWLLRGVIVLVATAALAALHWMSSEQAFRNGKLVPDLGSSAWAFWILGFGAVAAGILIILVRSAFRNMEALRDGRRVTASPRLRQLVALIVGGSLLALFVVFWATMAGGASRWITDNPKLAWDSLAARAPYLVAWANEWLLVPLDLPAGGRESALPLLFLVSVKTALVAYLFGTIDSLLNRSSFSTFYSGRLRSAYLGATNVRRLHVPLDHDDPNDEITLAAYYGKDIVAPIHLINVTINETTSRSSRVIQRDRKGKSMTIAPSGYLYPPGSPDGSLAILRRKDAEDLPLSSWMAISGAAFTTGAGHHTSLGTAMLATLTNMRLGYWWNSSNEGATWPLRRTGALVQAYLLRELRASYEGTCARRWYLSDGGHYENTGTYELIRRRIPFIIASDNGADPYYEFADLVNLMRKARIDFNTEIEFLDDPELDALFGEHPLRDVFGSLDLIRRSGKQATQAAADPGAKPPKAGPYATLARIRYPDTGSEVACTGTLLLIKPRITGHELPDLIQYRDVNAAFPQQPTTNQFFDEAQWESYYRLGQLIGDMIFKQDRFPAETCSSRWYPWLLEPLPA